MKLDALTPEELECYEDWNSASVQGGDCQTIGRAWVAFDDSPFGEKAIGGIIIIEDDQGFVDARTYRGEIADTYAVVISELQTEDARFESEASEGEE